MSDVFMIAAGFCGGLVVGYAMCIVRAITAAAKILTRAK